MGVGNRVDKLVELTTFILLALGGVLADAGFHAGTSGRGWFFVSGLAFGLAVYVPLSYFVLHPLFVRLGSWRANFLVRQDARRASIPRRSKRSHFRKVISDLVSDAGLAVTGAWYGPIQGGGGVDVSAIVGAKIDNGRLHFTVSNDELGGDPVEGSRKHLILNWTLDGNAHQNIVKEDDEVHIP